METTSPSPSRGRRGWIDAGEAWTRVRYPRRGHAIHGLSRRLLRRIRREMAHELIHRRLPGELLRVGASLLAGDVERAHAGDAQIFVQCAGAAVADDIDRAEDGVGGHGRAAGEGFEHDQAEGVGETGEHEYVGSAVIAGELRGCLDPGEVHVRIAAFELRA